MIQLYSSADGRKYEQAKRDNIPIVSHFWIDECFMKWQLVNSFWAPTFSEFFEVGTYNSLVGSKNLTNECINEWANRDKVKAERRTSLAVIGKHPSEAPAKATSSKPPSSETVRSRLASTATLSDAMEVEPATIKVDRPLMDLDPIPDDSSEPEIATAKVKAKTKSIVKSRAETIEERTPVPNRTSTKSVQPSTSKKLNLHSSDLILPSSEGRKAKGAASDKLAKQVEELDQWKQEHRRNSGRKRPALGPLDGELMAGSSTKVAKLNKVADLEAADFGEMSLNEIEEEKPKKRAKKALPPKRELSEEDVTMVSDHDANEGTISKYVLIHYPLRQGY